MIRSNFRRPPIRRSSKPSSVAKRKPTRPLERYALPNGITVQGWWHKDVSSPDGQRFEAANFAEFRKVKDYLRQLANGCCEKCPSGHYIGNYGHPHHDRHKKLGGGSTDDRIVVGTERQLYWVCLEVHDAIHAGRA